MNSGKELGIYDCIRKKNMLSSFSRDPYMQTKHYIIIFKWCLHTYKQAGMFIERSQYVP
jgi:hypothetical protein